jgi:hypothetical protein
MKKEEIRNIAEQRAMQTLNKFWSQFVGRRASYRYYGDREPADRYFYTCEKILHKGKPRYVAGIYRYYKTKEQWKMTKKIGFAKKKKAMEWARSAHELKK